MSEKKLLIFQIEEQNFAIQLELVDYVINMVEVKKVPHSSDFILGIINYYGDILPVIDMRHLFQLKNRNIELTDKLIIVNTKKEKICLWVDSIGEIVDKPLKMNANDNSALLELHYIDNIIILEGDIVFLQNVSNLFEKKEMDKLLDFIKQIKTTSDATKIQISKKRKQKEKKTNKKSKQTKTKKSNKKKTEKKT